MHETNIRVGIVVSENDISLQLLDTTVVNWVRVWNHIGPVTYLLQLARRLQILQHLSSLPLERRLLICRGVLPGYVQADSGNSLLNEDITPMNLSPP